MKQMARWLLLVLLVGCGRTEVGGSAGAPQITSFTASPTHISTAGEAVTLNWTVSATAADLKIDQGIGAVTGSGVVVNPVSTTTYTLTASNSSGNTLKMVTVTLDEEVPKPPCSDDKGISCVPPPA